MNWLQFVERGDRVASAGAAEEPTWRRGMSGSGTGQGSPAGWHRRRSIRTSGHAVTMGVAACRSPATRLSSACLAAWQRRQAEERLRLVSRARTTVLSSSMSWASRRTRRRSPAGRAKRSPERAYRRSGCTTRVTPRRPMLLRAGVPVKVVTQRLGHADVTVTLPVSQRVTAQDARAAAEASAGARRRQLIASTFSYDPRPIRRPDRATADSSGKLDPDNRPERLAGVAVR
jgi:hypothetical protein